MNDQDLMAKALISYLRGRQDPYIEQDPAYLDAAADYQNIPDRMGLQQFLMKKAEAQQETPMPGGRSVRGGIYVAPSPLEVGANAAQQVVGHIKSAEAQNAIAQLLRDRAATNRMGLGADQRMLKARAMQSQPAPASPDQFFPMDYSKA